MKEGKWNIDGWETSVMDLSGTEYEELLLLKQEKLLQILKDNLNEIDCNWKWYTESGERFGTNVEQSRPTLSYIYGKSLDIQFMITWILRYKMINQQRLIHWALAPEKREQIRKQMLSLLEGSPLLTYTEILSIFPGEEAELILDDLIESGHWTPLKRRREIR